MLTALGLELLLALKLAFGDFASVETEFIVIAMQSTFEYLDFSEPLTTALVPLALAAIVTAGLFGKITFLGNETRLTRLGSAIVILFATPIVLMAVPFWPDTEIEAERRPFCLLGHTANETGENFIYWFTDSSDNSHVRLAQGDGEYAPVSENGELVLTWGQEEVSKRFRLRADNRYDYCVREVRVNNPRIQSALKFSCKLDWGATPDNPDFDYRITWTVEGRQDFVAFINGAEVTPEGYANFVFNGPNYDRFRLVANASGETCENELAIYASDLSK